MKAFLIYLSLIVSLTLQSITAQDVLTPNDMLNLKNCRVHELSADGKQLIYSVITPRMANDKPGPAKVKHFYMSVKNKKSVPIVKSDLNISNPSWSPDGKHIAFLYKKDKEKKQVWAMPINGGEMKRLTNSITDVQAFKWFPLGNGIAYLSISAKTKKEEELKKRGYGFIFYEENIRKSNLYTINLDANSIASDAKQLTHDINVWDLSFNKQGTKIAFSASIERLIDHKYVFRRIYILDIASGKIIETIENEGKLGNYTFSPDGKNLAYVGAINLNDHAVSQAYIYSLESEQTVHLTPMDFRGHINHINWKNNEELLFYSSEGVYPKLSSISIKGGERKVLMDSEQLNVIFEAPLFSADREKMVFIGSTPNSTLNVYFNDTRNDIKRLTEVNPLLAKKALGKQEVFNFSARDGLKIEGILIKPVGYTEDGKYPLIVYVHGGPEAHHTNGWLSGYSTPGQLMARKGYLVAYLNYRASTGYGIDFAMEGFSDPAGKEFDDIADAIDYLIQEKNADKERVGMAGGSYGGYASAWFATYYTKYVKAVCMFVGISNLISKRGTTDIPYEELYVHSGKPLEEQWQMNLERSPVYWAHQSKTATLIYGGDADKRVHPSQSIELFRRMKMNNHPAVRLVQYPGEGHGNRNQVGRIDVLHRQAEWFDWYVKDLKPLDGPRPPLDISDKYGLDWKY